MTDRSALAGLAVAVLLLFAASASPAQAPAGAEPALTQAPAPICCTIPAGTIVQIELDQDLGSGRSRTGEMFPIHLVDPVVVDGRTLVPAGARGMGEVVHAAPRRWVSQAAGELILAARFLEAGEARVPLHRLGFARTGREGAFLVMSGPGFVSMGQGMGGNINVPAGTRLEARVRGEVRIPAQ
ncbi:MAG TPA: hypothetical protein VMS43_16770 [Allosphingosinicella sp.]|nr:hypothetical protein [Allosphingosinicella sp.]